MRAAFPTLLCHFVRDRRGNIAVIFALACVPLITVVGCAVDYSRATQIRSKLQAAADAASVGSIAKASPAFAAAGTMTSDGSIAVGVTDAQNIFNANVANLTGYTPGTVTPTVVKSGSTVTSTVTFSATVNTMFLGVIGKTSLALTGTSTSTATMPLYVDFYLLLDNSPSMGVAATPADITNMQARTGGCAFACHDTTKAAGTSNYDIAKANGITTRIDVVRQASANLMDTARNTQTYTNQFRMAIYDFGGASATIGLRNLFSLSSSLTSAKTAAGGIDLMAVAGQNDAYTADKDTPFTTIFPAINNEIASPGPGTSASPLKYLFLVSDGVADETNSGKTMCSVSSAAYPLYTPTNRCQSPINPALCKTLKDRGIKIAVLYTTYQPPTDSWYSTWIAPFNAGTWGPSPNSKIAQNMQACASPGLYFEVSPTQGISDAMNALFKKAVADARISG
ncbi:MULTISPECIES: TadE/TadG family type IV pilus assembly protein [Bradyrhizobium]|uniref:Pilus assembly protein n=1 Tax=Bradyrhizobium arachidis TaxID=858423 RepID=A0AAE7TEJ4_9BRAD|nr:MULTISPECIES: TadE/TadG family type IV pilus assembly protein [Bradyrhizobium]QOG22299.1 pilus assembly protein [Bradyrhizobium sp. SEMIA]QOZ65530.1 pilus assembly protein [Bradyrhizobium arachidis]UFW50082.1 pilus assembly protein [Bradyrhizobium arachidis]SFV18144.1 Flp pilus assembly protein TadG [Bradyrhizobium arachidis]